MYKITPIFRNIPLYLYISYFFIGLLLVFAVISNGYHYYQMKQLLMERAKGRINQLEQVITLELRRVYRPARLGVELFAQQRLQATASVEERLNLLPFLTTTLRNLSSISRVYAGFDNGDFFVLQSWHSDDRVSAEESPPPPKTAWVVHLRYEKKHGEDLFFDANLVLLARRLQVGDHYDPRTRPWYRSARHNSDLVVSNPYRDFFTHQLGVSFSHRMNNASGVVGMDVDLATVNTILQASEISPHTQLVLLSQKGEVLTGYEGKRAINTALKNDAALPTLAELHSPLLNSLYQQFQNYIQEVSANKDITQPSSIRVPDSQADLVLKLDHRDMVLKQNGEQWQGTVRLLPLPHGGLMTLMIAAPFHELLSNAYTVRNQSVMIALGVLFLGILLVFLFARLASRPLHALMEEARKIERFEFDRPVNVKSHITEVAQLASAMGRMKLTIQRFLDLSIALSSETQFHRLLDFLLQEMQTITHAQGGIVYLVQTGNAAQLQVTQAKWQTTTLAELSTLANINLSTDVHHPVVQALLSGEKTQNLSAAMLHDHFAALIPIAQDLTMLVLPLNNRNGERLGALILFIDEKARILTPERLAFVEALSSTASLALYTQGLVNAQKQLLESFIQLIAGAIDAKSPYTGGHCQRVPELTKMIAYAACAQKNGPFRDYTLSEDEWEALHIAAWLHDCGKVTTPEYIVDKATKLETLYDRIHEVRMRFEVLKRDAQITYWQAIAQGEDAQTTLNELHATLKALDEEFVFVASCNEGGEFMSPQKVEKLRQIASRTWQRTLSDRIGISHDEKQRKSRTVEPSLPVNERLLADKPEHIILRNESERLPTGNPWGFKVNVPEYLYHRGELHNLSVSRGTLSEEERYKINEHITQTIIMLEKLPFPPHLKNVPEIAGGHHEKMDGTGYPRRLTQEQMSIEARMMAIADIFEALTAADRPYKRGKKLSEALEIMSAMCKNRHLDLDLFTLFLRSGVYKEYADKYMLPEQKDEIEIDDYLPK